MIDINKLKQFLNDFQHDASVWQKWRAERSGVMTVMQSIMPASDETTEVNTAISTRDWKKLYVAIATYMSVDDIKLQRSAIARLLYRILDEEKALESIDAWQVLFDAELLCKDNFEKVAKHQNAKEVINALKQLAKLRMLNRETFNQVLAHPHVKSLDEALAHLRNVRKSYFSVTKYFPRQKEEVSYSFELSLIMSPTIAMVAFMAATVYFSTVLLPSLISVAIGGFAWLSIALVRRIHLAAVHPLKQSVNLLLTSKQPAELIEAQDKLGFFERNHPMRELLRKNENPLALLFVLRSIKTSKISRNDSAAFLAHAEDGKNMNYFKEFLVKMMGEKTKGDQFCIVSQSDMVFSINHMNIATHPDIFLLLQDERVVNNRAELKRIILEVSAQDQPEDQKVRLITVRCMRALNRQDEQINDEQSTHRVSVHKSSSESAQRLHEAYREQIQSKVMRVALEKEIKLFLRTLPPDENGSHVHAAAQSAFDTIRKSNHIDNTSNVSLRNLLFYAWIGIHDHSRYSQISLEERKACFVNALYEIQRGYNLNAAQQDDGEADKSICPPGMFNKLIECMKIMQHPLADQVYITKETANLKLRQLVEHALVDHLDGLIKKTMILQDLVAARAYIDEILSEGVMKKALWDLLQPKILDEFTTEFHSLFENNEDAAKFVAGGMFFELDEDKYAEHFTNLYSQKEDELKFRISEHGLFFRQQHNLSDPASVQSSSSHEVCRINRLVLHKPF